MKSIFTPVKKKIAFILCSIIFFSHQSLWAQVYFSENFNGNSLPTSWTDVNLGTGPARWYIHAPGIIGLNNLSMLGSNFLFVSSDSGGLSTVANETLTSPNFTAPQTTQVILEFYQHYKDFSGTPSDSGIVEVFNGASWVKLQKQVGSSIGTGTAPVQTKFDVSSSVNAEMKIRFRYYGKYAFYWAIDDIKVYSPSAKDVGVLNLILPVSKCGLDANVPVRVKLKNFGSQSQTNFPLSFSVNGSPAVSENFTSILSPGDTTSYTFLTTAQTTTSGTYSFSAWTSLVDDANPDNDSIKNRRATREGSTFTEIDFTGFTGQNLSTIFPGWSERSGLDATGTTSSWMASLPAQTAALGSLTARVNLFSNFVRYWIVSKPFVPVANSVFRFKIAVTANNSIETSSMGTDDSLIVKVSANCGTTWTNVKFFTNADRLTNQLVEFDAPLTQFGGNQLLIGIYATDGSINNSQDYDIHIDDLEVLVPVPNDLQVSKIILPDLTCGVGDSLILQIGVRNSGTQALSSIPVSYSVNGQDIVSQTFTQNLAPKSSTILTFSVPIQFPNFGNYFISAWANLAGDQNLVNDSIKNEKVAKKADPLLPVNFTGYTGVNISAAFPGWKEQTGLIPLGTSSTWGSGLSLHNTSLGNGPTAGINLFFLNKKDWLTSPSFLVEAGKVLQFKAAVLTSNGVLASLMGSDDSLKVKISNNCGQSWKTVFFFNVQNVPGNQFSTYEVPLAEYEGQNIVVAFYATDGDVNDVEDYFFYLDDVSQTLSTSSKLRIEQNSILYPNPADQIVHIKFENQSFLPNDLEIIGLDGRAIKNEIEVSKEEDGLRVNVGKLIEGIYWVRIRNGEKLISRPLVIKH